MSAKLLSCCCGALPTGGVARNYVLGGKSYTVGECSICRTFGVLAPGGVLDTQPAYLRLPPLRPVPEPQAAREAQLARLERSLWLRELAGHALIVLLGVLLLLVFWIAWQDGEAERGQRARQGVSEQGVGSGHALQGSK